MTRARDMANLGSQAGSGLDASDITTGTLGNTVQDNVTRLGTVTVGTYNATIGSSATFPAGHIVKWEEVTMTPSATQGTDSSYIDLTGSSKAYTPATGASKVVYEYRTMFSHDGSDVNSLILYKFIYDGSAFANSNWGAYRPISDENTSWGYQEFKFVLPAWTGAKTMSLQYRAYNSSYEGMFHKTQHSGDGTSTNIFAKIYQVTYSVM
mgnify:CR=1 FL=1